VGKKYSSKNGETVCLGTGGGNWENTGAEKKLPCERVGVAQKWRGGSKMKIGGCRGPFCSRQGWKKSEIASGRKLGYRSVGSQKKKN